MITLVLVVVAFVGGAVFSKLFFRANPKKNAIVDAEINKLAGK